MSMSNHMKWAGCALGAMLLSVSASGQSYKQPIPPGFMRLDAEDIKPGTIFGDPSKPGMYVTRTQFLPGRGSRPHYHDQDRYITVIKGTWWVSLGSEADVYNPEKMTPVKQGSFIFEPAFGHHYDQARDEEVIVQIMGPGPVKTTSLEEAGAGAAGSPERSGGRGRSGGTTNDSPGGGR
jgi:quercetin dioxygenase-like cupin family protein